VSRDPEGVEWLSEYRISRLFFIPDVSMIRTRPKISTWLSSLFVCAVGALVGAGILLDHRYVPGDLSPQDEQLLTVLGFTVLLLLRVGWLLRFRCWSFDGFRLARGRRGNLELTLSEIDCLYAGVPLPSTKKRPSATRNHLIPIRYRRTCFVGFSPDEVQNGTELLEALYDAGVKIYLPPRAPKTTRELQRLRPFQILKARLPHPMPMDSGPPEEPFTSGLTNTQLVHHLTVRLANGETRYQLYALLEADGLSRDSTKWLVRTAVERMSFIRKTWAWRKQVLRAQAGGLSWGIVLLVAAMSLLVASSLTKSEDLFRPGALLFGWALVKLYAALSPLLESDI